jgi:hypothetical protein
MQGQLVLQCRQQPESFRIQQETMKFKQRWPSHTICPHTSSDIIEWLSKSCNGTIPYRLLLRVFPQQPQPWGPLPQGKDPGGGGFCSPIDG